MLIREVVGHSVGHHWHYIGHNGHAVPFLWHYHPEFELTLTRDSRGIRYIGDDVQPFDELDLALVAPNCAHTWHDIAEDDHQQTRIHVAFFTRDWLIDLAEHGLPELIPLTHWLAGIHQGVVFPQSLAADVVPLFERVESDHGLARLNALFEILQRLPASPGRHLGIGRSLLPGRDRRIETVLRHLQENYRKPVMLDDVAEIAACSPSTLKRLLRERLGMSVTDILIQLRLGHASHLLISTEASIQRVANESGFNNLGHFFRQFSTRRGCTPEEFRRRNHLSFPARPHDSRPIGSSTTADRCVVAHDSLTQQAPPVLK